MINRFAHSRVITPLDGLILITDYLKATVQCDLMVTVALVNE